MMVDLHLVVGSKNFTSWSLRAWGWLRRNHVPFTETIIALYESDTSEKIRQFGCGSTVPILVDGEIRLWDSLAILEYLVEKYPRFGGWPTEAGARAYARSVSAEMHSVFSALRAEMPMNCNRGVTDFEPNRTTLADIARVEYLWNHCREMYENNGPWLFGDYSIADAMYAPVVLRFNTYGITVSGSANRYMKTVLQQQEIREWLAASKVEPSPSIDQG